MKRLGLYIHIPFCRSKCHYCDFCSMPHPEKELVNAYVERLCGDLSARASLCRDYTVDSVYLGGGTPTLLEAALLCRILDTVRAHYHLCERAEITLECNPATGSAEGFSELRKAGFNRVSVGLQSTHKNELRALGRLHSLEDFARTVQLLRGAGFENISADVMQGIPEQTRESYLDTLRTLISLEPAHISAYALSIEEGTRFYELRDRLPLPDEDAARDAFFEGAALLEQNGYGWYEISNFARAGYESRHNLKYWNCEEYLGFGPAAHSFFGGERFGNGGDIRAYIAGEDVECERARIGTLDAANEYVMLRMRLSEGVDVKAFEARYPYSFEEAFGKALAKYIPTGHVKKTAGGYAFTHAGFYVSNTILSDVLSFG